ncbi:MAG TPA: hypothetical protein VI248_28605 [Kineosporiaceae bacterium]
MARNEHAGAAGGDPTLGPGMGDPGVIVFLVAIDAAVVWLQAQYLLRWSALGMSACWAASLVLLVTLALRGSSRPRSLEVGYAVLATPLLAAVPALAVCSAGSG